MQLDHSRFSQKASHSHYLFILVSLHSRFSCVATSPQFMEVWALMSKALRGYFPKGRLISREGKEMVAHHDNIKPCVVPATEGIIHCTPPEDTAMHFLLGRPFPQGGINAQTQRPASRPAQLKRIIHPPLRYGEVVTH